MAASTRSSVSLSMSLLLVLFLHRPSAVSTELGFDSIYQFGDSDTGNVMVENPSSACSNRPYGETFFGKPTGRCSNGLLIVDYFARAFNLPPLNPYLQRDSNFTHGVNFAVVGATALISSRYPSATTNSSLSVQLEWFRTHVQLACSSSSDTDFKKKFERSLFIVGEGVENDYNHLLFERDRRLLDVGHATDSVPLVVQAIVDAVKEVIEHGAIQVIVPGIFPIGCTPIYFFNLGDYSAEQDNDGCLEKFNGLSRFHNEHLKQAIKDLQREYPGAAIYYGDYYSAYKSALLGFDRAERFRPCCGDFEHSCDSSEGTPLCQDPTKRVSWDGVHPTQEANKKMAQWLLSNTFSQGIVPSPEPSPYWPESSGANVVSKVFLQAIAASVLAIWAIDISRVGID